MELVMRDGQSYFVPVSDRENTGIVNFNRWEQAFRVYSNIYLKEHAGRASELIQYNQVIFTVSQSYIWENVYLYDKEFRMHLSHFPNHNWGVILQQAWTMYLKDRIKIDESRKHGGSNGGNNYKKKEPCQRYNKGLCTAGSACRYEHCCTVPGCGKFGHGAHICRKRIKGDSGADSSQGGSSGNVQANRHHASNTGK